MKTVRIVPIIVADMTAHPAMKVIISGIPGTVSVFSIMPEPTTRATIAPTIHAKIPRRGLSFIFYFVSFLVFLL